MKEMIRDIFELWVRKNWLKQILREGKKVSKYLNRYQHHKYIYDALNFRYNEIYGSKKKETENEDNQVR